MPGNNSDFAISSPLLSDKWGGRVPAEKQLPVKGLLQRSTMIRNFIIVLVVGIFLIVQMQFISNGFYIRTYHSVRRQIKDFQGAWINGEQVIDELESNPHVETARILWWSTFWGDKNSGVPGVGKGKKLQELVKGCSKKCEFVFDKGLVGSSHAVVFHAWHHDIKLETVGVGPFKKTVPKNVPKTRSEDQIYVLYLTEAPARVQMDLKPYSYFFNWTITHRQDADFPNTYGRFNKKSKKESQAYDTTRQNVEIMKNKTNLIAWTASNCKQAPSARNELVKSLQQHIPVDVYGKCGNFTCKSRSALECHKDLGRRYKFYLAFENSRCEDYVTEKYFDSLVFNTVPIVYGGANYGLRFPAASFINVDSFASASALAQYLKYLDENDEEYVKYFEWKKYYTVDNTFRYSKVWCGLCEKIHETYKRKKYILNAHEFLFNNKTGYNPVCTTPHKFI